MNSNSPTHEQISERAQQLWRQRGNPEGQDNEIWLEAERQLSAPARENNAPSKVQGRGNGNTQGGGSTPADPSTANRDSGSPFATAGLSTTPAGATAKVTQQKKEARAPKVSAKTAPKTMPPESGKPLWDKPHSS
ncbi:MAG TPA: DUF2934 domain-containing protein [Opitutaceae bacterium]|nr:DUF2934 domain-containing protein [Opitutaceae bacterium]